MACFVYGIIDSIAALREHQLCAGMENVMNENSVDEGNRTVADIMTARVIFIREEDNLTSISKGMDRYHLRHLPVVSEGKLMGIVSHRDLLRLAVGSFEADTPEGKAKQQAVNENTFVAAIMTRDPVTVTPGTSIKDAAKIIVESKFGCLPVVEEDNILVGIVTEHDFVKLLAE